ncbi:MAG: NAD(P)H-dependent oxidoreductase subunit E [Deltaproteobacteria bacterium]|jgi:NADH-quinone oxidoreductase subunit E|nr:NAD(P)H-dependent oxidoreductase subunit E [Deltaproteobacteria bacterium]MBW2532824.1 NAD(P)H-dependent oxidoreductase subunit E [Deltaproteobacteria bacterium]
MKPTLDPEEIIRITAKHEGSRGALISILEDIQASYNYLPREALKIVAKKTAESLVDIYGVATFYRAFSLEPRGEHIVSVCMGTACHVRGAPRILDAFEQTLGVYAGQTTQDRRFTLQTVNCLGACALGPVVVVDGRYERNVAETQVEAIVRRCKTESSEAQIMNDESVFRVDVSCPSCNRSLMTYDHLLDGQPMVHVTATFRRKHGWMRFSSGYGDYRVQSEHEIPDDGVANFFCPKCHAELHSAKICSSCDAPMIPLFVRGGGVVQFCARRGCKEHMLDLGD